jgi:pyruvate dehydrogenase E2 component (dihydrolipoamide acetyltransferase)
MPQLGLTMTEGMVVEWCLAPGARIRKGDIMFVVETDKIANEILADRDGVLATVLVPAGETVPVGAVLGHWQGDGSESSETSVSMPAVAATTGAPVAATPPHAPGARVIATPHARKLARAAGVELSQLCGSGPKGRIKAEDVRRAGPSAPRVAPSTAGTAHRRQVIAQRMQQAKRDIPHFYLSAHAEVSELEKLHKRVRELTPYRGLTLTHWLVAALGMVLEAEPRFRQSWRGAGPVQFEHSDVALAVAMPEGLMAPVARRVGQRPLVDLVGAVNGLIERARNNRLAHDDVAGGTICISNLGAYAIDLVAPIIIPGQAMILGVGRTQGVFRPDAQGAPQARRELGLVLASDHRVFDGTDGAELLTRFVQLLEDPVTILADARRG